MAPPSGAPYQSPVQAASDRLRISSLRQIDGLVDDYNAFIAAGKSEAEAIETAKKTLADSLRDPGAAQFRNVRTVSYNAGKVICGEVNGKNAYGAYVGFKPFAASPTKNVMETPRGKYPEVDALANTGLFAACPR